MGKNMHRRHANDELDDLEHVHPSCMWGFVHSIDYHNWHFNIKRMFLQKINPRKHAKGSRSSKAKELVHDPGEQKKLLNEEEKHFTNAKESGLNHKRSMKTRIKSLIAEEMSKDRNGKQRGSSISSQSRLQRTYSIHHLEPPDHGFGEICSDWEHPILFIPSKKENSATKLQNPANMNVKNKQDTYGKKSKKLSNKDASKDREHANVVEIFKVNEDLFLEIVQDKDGSFRKFSHTLPGSNAKARLTKSGSFPAAELLRKKSLEPSTLKQKQSEIWATPRDEKLPTSTLMLNVDKLKHPKHVRSKSLPLECNSRGSKLGQALNFVLENTSEPDAVDKKVLKPLNESKQSDHFEVREGRNQANSSTLSVLSEVSSRHVSSRLENDSAERYEATTTNRVDEKNFFRSHETQEYSFSKETRSHKRSSSLNESMEKYTWLFENNFGKEVKLHPLRSLKLRNEYEMGSGGNASTLFRRIRSLSNVDIYSSLPNCDANLEGWPITTVEENGSCKKDSYLDELKPAVFSPTAKENVAAGDIEESVHQNELLGEDGCINQMENFDESRENFTSRTEDLEEKDDALEEDGCINQMENFAESRENFTSRMEDLEEKDDTLTVVKSTLYMEQGSKCYAIAPSELPQACPASVFETHSEGVSHSLEFQASEGSEHFDEKASSINCKKIFDMEPSLFSRMPNLDHMKDFDHVESYNEYDADLDYVRDILENSGFAKDAFYNTWHSPNQPLDPLIFDEMEAYWHKECSAEDYCGCHHHRLLFDLVNDMLLHIYRRSFTYYPRALSSSCYIRPFPMGDRIVDEMCTSVSTLMRLKTAQKQSLECLVALDVGKDDGWMNLQFESECVGLELEDMIIDELLEELVCS